MNHIELFAGCGGLCLGLQSEKFELLFANELSPMASETFSYNLLDEDLDFFSKLKPGSGKVVRTKWLSSKYKLTDLSSRLRENPKTFPKLGKGYGDIEKASDFQKNMIVGSVVQLNKWLSMHPVDLNIIQSGFGAGSVDLVSGGPPCQSFSMAGMRDYSNSRNNLPRDFANFVSMVRPRFALLENVTGILRPFEVKKKKVYAWFEVAKAFAKVGYVPLCLHVNARFVGVAQNRTRFLMVMFRRDVFAQIKIRLNKSELSLLEKSEVFFQKMMLGKKVAHSELPVFDVSRDADMALYKDSFLRHLVEFSDVEYSVKDAIDDLRFEGNVASKYVEILRENVGGSLIKADTDSGTVLANTELRKHGKVVKGRFRIYQVVQILQAEKSSAIEKKAAKEVLSILRGEENVLSEKCARVLMGHTYYLDEESDCCMFGTRQDLENFFKNYRTKKQTQRALDAAAPAPAALAIPDDACHYHRRELRTLSVREMARIQSFPDNFVFRSKATTGGEQRKFEVPQYTQVGNAVPPMLGRAIGKVFNELAVRIQPDVQTPLTHSMMEIKTREIVEA
jgi:DNA (cytosine-5)-methyltransferase 1